MPRAVDYDLCAFCPRLCRHACPVAVGSGREAATPTHVMAGVWGWLQEHRSAPEALALASLCTRCGACTDACKLARPVDDLLTEARGAAAPEPLPWVMVVIPPDMIKSSLQKGRHLCRAVLGREPASKLVVSRRSVIGVLSASGPTVLA